MAKKSFAVIGLGEFGQFVAGALLEHKCDVTVFDNNEGRVNNFQAAYPTANVIITDVTNPNFVHDQGIDNFNGIILTICTDLEVGLLSAVMLYNAHLNLFVRAKDKLHAKILKKIGIKQVFLPENQTAKIIASQALFGINSSVQVVNDDYVITEIAVQDPNKIGKSLRELNLVNKKDYNIVHLTRNHQVKLPAEIDQLQLGDRLLVVSKINKINYLKDEFRDSSSNDSKK